MDAAIATATTTQISSPITMETIQRIGTPFVQNGTPLRRGLVAGVRPEMFVSTG
jgi:hypothetical protein